MHPPAASRLAATAGAAVPRFCIRAEIMGGAQFCEDRIEPCGYFTTEGTEAEEVGAVCESPW